MLVRKYLNKPFIRTGGLVIVRYRLSGLAKQDRGNSRQLIKLCTLAL